MKRCCACQKEKPIKSFYKTNVKSVADRCKICNKEGKMCKENIQPKKQTGNKRNTDGPQLFRVRKEDWIKTYQFLETLGYDLEKNIHHQFCEKHNLPIKKRNFENSTLYSPKDLGLI